MKIVHALAYYGDYIGGIQAYVKELSKRQRIDGNQVKIITSDLYGSQKEIDGVQIIRVKTLFSAFRVPFTPALPYFLLREKCDILHVHLPLPWLDICAFIKKVLNPGTKLIITIHNNIPNFSRFSKIFSLLHNRLMISLPINVADAITSTTSEFVKVLPYKLPSGKLKIVPCGVDINQFKPLKKYNKNQILFVGRLIPEKGLHVLMEAMKLVRKEKKNAKLIAICAETYNYKNYEKMIVSMDDGFLELKKNIPNRLMPRYFSNSNCFVMPSVDLESFGIVLLEAMASECPVIVSDLPGPMSVVEGHGGLVVKKNDPQALADAILLTLRMPKEIRENMRDYVKSHFSWEIVNKKMMCVYNAL